MKFFYEGINKFMYKHSFIKSCVYFASKFCPWMVAIFYSLFLLKIVIESQTGFYLLFIKPFVVLLITVLLRILIDRPRPIQKYDLKPIDDKKRIGLFPKYSYKFSYFYCFDRYCSRTKYGIITLSTCYYNYLYKTDYRCSLFNRYSCKYFNCPCYLYHLTK